MTHAPITAPYGSWPSPISPAEVAHTAAPPEWVDFVGEEVWWTQTRPDEEGRSALVRRDCQGTVCDVLPAPWDVRNKVVGYGGRPWAALSARAEDGIVFTHGSDQRVYLWRPDTQAPVPLTPAPNRPGGLRYCDFAVMSTEVWCLRETVQDAQDTQVRRDLVAIPLDAGAAENAEAVRVLAASHHYMTGPRVSPDRQRVAWIGWDPPHMPWDRTEVMEARIAPDGSLSPPKRLLGGADESVIQIDWDLDCSTTLYALSDAHGWWNLYRITSNAVPRQLCPRPEEFGEALWRIGTPWFRPLHANRLAVIHGTGTRRLGILHSNGHLTDVASEATDWSWPATDGDRVAAVLAGPTQSRTVAMLDPASGHLEPLYAPPLPHSAYFPRPFRETFRRADGTMVHAHVYPPHHPTHRGPDNELPPYLVLAHGGPTGRGRMVADTDIAFFTSRGIGIVDVQYAGSTGYGRGYRKQLNGQWGILDVRDCAAAARGLIADGHADPARIGIRGGSAGGWTAALSLVMEPDLYAAASIYYPVLDAVTWRTEGTHDFEAHYLDSLIGPWPQSRDQYQRRSLTGREHRIRAPFALLQGLRDTVCPPAQVKPLLEQAQATSMPHLYLAFNDEAHGFRHAATVVQCLEAEMDIYARSFGFSPEEFSKDAETHGPENATDSKLPVK